VKPFYRTMNTRINFNDPHLAGASVLAPALDGHNHAPVSSATETLSYSQSPKRGSFGVANSAWPGSWTWKGIPELDSPLAD
jgi:hypothetical protein